MRVKYSDAVVDALGDVPSAGQKAFFKQTRMLQQNLRRPSLRAKKYDEADDRWLARVNRVGASTSRSKMIPTSSPN